MFPINDNTKDTEYFLVLYDSVKEHRAIFSLMLMLYFKIIEILFGATVFTNLSLSIVFLHERSEGLLLGSNRVSFLVCAYFIVIHCYFPLVICSASIICKN